MLNARNTIAVLLRKIKEEMNLSSFVQFACEFPIQEAVGKKESENGSFRFNFNALSN